MSVWVWVLIGAADLVTLSLLIGLVAAAILGSISREVSDLLDLEPWATATLTPASEALLTTWSSSPSGTQR